MTPFFTQSEHIQQIIKSFNLTKTLFVSSIIIGEANTGKKTLARYLFPDTPIVSAKDKESLIQALENNDELIISDLETLTNHSLLDFSNKRIIATANYIGNHAIIDDLFAFIYTMPALQERPKDTIYLKDLYTKEAANTLMLDVEKLNMDSMVLNLKNNTKSLKKSIYTHLFKQSVEVKDIEDILYTYLLSNLNGNDEYKKYLSLYEKPLITAGLKKFGSQLQLSQVLGINRNTLRKKIYEHKLD